MLFDICCSTIQVSDNQNCIEPAESDLSQSSLSQTFRVYWVHIDPVSREVINVLHGLQLRKSHQVEELLYACLQTRTVPIILHVVTLPWVLVHLCTQSIASRAS